jgi:hypothetical protein
LDGTVVSCLGGDEARYTHGSSESRQRVKQSAALLAFEYRRMKRFTLRLFAVGVESFGGGGGSVRPGMVMSLLKSDREAGAELGMRGFSYRTGTAFLGK